LQQKIRLVLNDEQWKRIEKLCAGKPEDPGGTGANNRMFVEAVLWIARTGSPWRDLPAFLASGTVFLCASIGGAKAVSGSASSRPLPTIRTSNI
jgi:transposase